MVVTPGKQPMTRFERKTILESGIEVLYNCEDIRNFDKQALPIAIAFNELQKYTPTAILSTESYNNWKLDKLSNICTSGIEIIQSLHMDSLTSEDKPFISGLNLDFHKFTVKYATTEDNCLSAVRSVPEGPLFVSQPIPPQEQPIPGTSAQHSLPLPASNKKNKNTFVISV